MMGMLMHMFMQKPHTTLSTPKAQNLGNLESTGAMS